MDYPYVFKYNWFDGNIPYLEPILSEFAGKPVKFLEIGSFEGKSAVWMFQNILTHPDAKLVCIDTFEGDDGHTPEKENLLNRFLHNVEPFKDKITVIKSTSADALRAMDDKESFDMIYIDGCHYAANVLEDAVLSFPLLRKQGMIVFDDYTNGHIHSIMYPHIGINCFVTCYANQLDVIAKYHQLVVRKN